MNEEYINQLLNNHAAEINNNNFEPFILDCYLRYGEAGLTDMKELMEESELGELYRKSAEKIIKILVRTSGILDD